MDQVQRNSRIVYPKLAAPLMDEDLRLLFTIQSDEWAWARSVELRRISNPLVMRPRRKLFTGNRYFWQVSVNTPLQRRMISSITGDTQDGRG